MLFRSEVAKVYNRITDGAFSDMETPAEDILDEFEFCYGRLAKDAADLEDKLDELFKDCQTVDDCKEALGDYFGWDTY